MMSLQLFRRHDVGGATVQRHGWRFSVALKIDLNPPGLRGRAPGRAGMQGAFAQQRPLPPAARSRANHVFTAQAVQQILKIESLPFFSMLP